jgi:hypothetical protein
VLLQIQLLVKGSVLLGPKAPPAFSLMRFEAVIPEPAEDYKNRNVVEPAFNQLKN